MDDEAIARGAQTLMDELLTNPKTKHAMEAAIKTLHPTVVTKADEAAPLINAIKNVNSKVDQTINWLKAREVDSNLAKEFGRVKDSYGFTDEGMDEIKRLMISEKIPSPEAAAALYEKRHPAPGPQEPSLFAPQQWGFGNIPDNDEDLKLLWKNEDQWAEKQARQVLKEISQGTYKGD